MLKAVQVGNVSLSTDIIIVLGSLAAATLVFNIILHSVRYIRTLTCLNNHTQRLFKIPQPFYAFVKQHLLYAPLAGRQHSKEMRIGVVDVGTLPTRLQSILLAGIIAMNVAFAFVGMEWNGTPPDNPMPYQTLLQHLRNRVGTLAIFNMIPLIILAGRNNPLIGWLGISFSTFNLLHRWFGRIVACHAIVHGVVEFINMDTMAYGKRTTGIAVFGQSLQEAPFILWGFIVRLSKTPPGVLIIADLRPVRPFFPCWLSS